MLSILGHPRSSCDGISRRSLLQAGTGLLGVNLRDVLAAEALGNRNLTPRARSVLFVFLYGGPSQLETFDMKPEAPSGMRGPFQPIASRTPGLRICEHLPRLAQRSDRFAVVRTVNHPQNDHNGTHFIQTGYPLPPADRGAARVAATDKDWPAFGSVISYLDERRHQPDRRQDGGVRFPPYVYLPRLLGHFAGYDINGQYAGWLGKAFDPMATAIQKRNATDNPYYRDCTDKELDFRLAGLEPQPSITLDRLHRRHALLKQFDAERSRFNDSRQTLTYDTRHQQAMDLLTSESVASAFDLRQEPHALRDRYGRNLFGQSLLMGRRLIEAGSRFVTVAWDMAVRGDDTTSWDSHRSLTRVMQNHLLPGLDRGLPTLLDDMHDRGLLDETLVFVAGEMGRTPKFQNRGSEDGRDHWTYCFPCLFAGAGVRGGLTYGASDKHAAYPLTHPVSPADLAATIFESLGISPDQRIPNASGQPVSLVDNGTSLRSLFG
ncbi:MAG: DUF1501 domain-containing protein [Planctomycetaceae bacterium]